jgi:hypothetical protein
LFGFEIAPLGINCSDIYEAKKNAEIFCGIFNADKREIKNFHKLPLDTSSIQKIRGRLY